MVTNGSEATPQSRSCRVCGRGALVGSRAMRCATCAALVAQAGNRGSSRRAPIRPQVAEEAIRAAAELAQGLYPESGGYACAYSCILLEVDKKSHQQGDYVSFDHVVPNNGNEAVLCSRIVNDLKGWMTGIEFRTFLQHVLETDVPRSIHRQELHVSREFLQLLQRAAGGSASMSDLARLKELSRGFRY